MQSSETKMWTQKHRRIAKYDSMELPVLESKQLLDLILLSLVPHRSKYTQKSTLQKVLCMSKMLNLASYHFSVWSAMVSRTNHHVNQHFRGHENITVLQSYHLISFPSRSLEMKAVICLYVIYHQAVTQESSIVFNITVFPGRSETD